MSASDGRLHFGLGEAPAVRGIGVVWPLSGPELYDEKRVNTLVVLREGQGTAWPAGPHH